MNHLVVLDFREAHPTEPPRKPEQQARLHLERRVAWARHELGGLGERARSPVAGHLGCEALELSEVEKRRAHPEARRGSLRGHNPFPKSKPFAAAVPVFAHRLLDRLAWPKDRKAAAHFVDSHEELRKWDGGGEAE